MIRTAEKENCFLVEEIFVLRLLKGRSAFRDGPVLLGKDGAALFSWGFKSLFYLLIAYRKPREE